MGDRKIGTMTIVYTVKQLARLAGVSGRTLHYYDEIGLLKPSSVGENGYRYYDEAAILRLQQILFFRELDFSLSDIQTILDRPEFDVVEALQAHKQALQSKVHRLSGLIQTVDQTILHLKGELPMETEQLFAGFDEETQKRYEQEAYERYDPAVVKASVRRWNGYTAEQKAQIGAEGEAVYQDLQANMDKGPESPEVQQAIARWHQHLRYFYEPTLEIMLGLAQGYAEDPAFAALYRQMHPDMPQFLRQAIEHYCLTLPTP
jgi:DNA-binding transcriptional MerR regulator